NSDYLAEVTRRRKINEDRIRIAKCDEPPIAPDFFNGTVQLPHSTADNAPWNARGMFRHIGKSETGLRLSVPKKPQTFRWLSNNYPFSTDSAARTAADQARPRKLPASFANVASAHGHGEAPGVVLALVPHYVSALGPTIKPMGRPPKGDHAMSGAEKQ